MAAGIALSGAGGSRGYIGCGTATAAGHLFHFLSKGDFVVLLLLGAGVGEEGSDV